MSITLIDSSEDSLTVSWTAAAAAAENGDKTSPGTPSNPSSIRYILQYRTANSDDDEAFETLSDKLTSTQARKRNLTDPEGVGFVFRVAANYDAESDDNNHHSWMTHSEPFWLLPHTDAQHRMTAPTVYHAGSNLAARTAWKAVDGATGYELQMRENEGGKAWETIAANLSGTEVKKKNLSSKNGYQFRVRPSMSQQDNNSNRPFSAPSDAFVALGLSEGMKQLFGRSLENGVLLRQHNQPPVNLEDALGGKEFVLLYASAHWCGPCRSFTPQLANWYQSLGPNKMIEIVFLSADHDEHGFQNYYSTMPWTAVPYDDDGREGLMAHIRVQGIPRLAVLDGRTGRIIEDNAVGKPLDINRWRKLAAS